MRYTKDEFKTEQESKHIVPKIRPVPKHLLSEEERLKIWSGKEGTLEAICKAQSARTEELVRAEYKGCLSPEQVRELFTELNDYCPHDFATPKSRRLRKSECVLCLQPLKSKYLPEKEE